MNKFKESNTKFISVLHGTHSSGFSHVNDSPTVNNFNDSLTVDETFDLQPYGQTTQASMSKSQGGQRRIKSANRAAMTKVKSTGLSRNQSKGLLVGKNTTGDNARIAYETDLTTKFNISSAEPALDFQTGPNTWQTTKRINTQ